MRISKDELTAYRRSFDYRSAYFRKNPGIFGCVWFCSQCFKPLFGRKSVCVDHIVPLARGGKNAESNCTAICRKCNSRKSDKVDGRIVKGKFFKLFESTFFKSQRGVMAILSIAIASTIFLSIKTVKLTLGFAAGCIGIGKHKKLCRAVLLLCIIIYVYLKFWR